MRSLVSLHLLLGSLGLLGRTDVLPTGTSTEVPARALLAQSRRAEDLLERTRAAYAALRSYADSGTVEVEFGSLRAPLRERHGFVTYYRAPRHFYFAFTKADRADRFVVWSDDEAFHTWWRATGVTETYPKGEGATAFAIGAAPTLNSLTLVAPLIFAGAGLEGTLTEFADATIAGKDTVGGRACDRLVGVARSRYQKSGNLTNVRRTTLWIDAETFLVRRIVEDGSEGGALNRTTTVLRPHADPPLDDGQFRFVPPAAGS